MNRAEAAKILRAERDQDEDALSSSATSETKRLKKEERRKAFASMLLGISEENEVKEKKWYLIYPKNSYKFAFDIFVGLVLLYSCNMTAV